MQIVIPMAGIGKRFLDAGYKEPKPLIKVGGKPMIQYVIEFFPGEENFIFICNQKHLEETPLREVLLNFKPHATIIPIEAYERGPVANILLSGEAVSDNGPIMVSYCDFDMIWNYEDFKMTMQEKNPASASICYKGFHPHLLAPNLYAGVRVDEHLHALEVQEKTSFTPNKMDTWQQNGVFYFQSGTLLKKYAEITTKSEANLNGEHYVSHMYNPMIKDGLSSLVYPIDYFCQWGTPEDLDSYNQWIGIVEKNGTPEEAVQVFRDRDIQVTRDDGEKILKYWREFIALKNKHD